MHFHVRWVRTNVAGKSLQFVRINGGGAQRRPGTVFFGRGLRRVTGGIGIVLGVGSPYRQQHSSYRHIR